MTDNVIHIATRAPILDAHQLLVQTAATTGIDVASMERQAKDLATLTLAPLEDCMDLVSQLAHKEASRVDEDYPGHYSDDDEEDPA